MDKKFEDSVKKFVKEVGVRECHKAGLAAMMMAFYCGTELEYDCCAGADEVANDLGISAREFNWWDDLYYKKDSWFNQMEG